MDTYVSISEKRHHHILRSGLNKPLTDPCPANQSLDSLLKRQSKCHRLILEQAKLPLQNPCTSFTLRGARSG